MTAIPDGARRRAKKRKRAGEWSCDTTITENFVCAILIATGIFHDSEYGERLNRTFPTGSEVRVTISHRRRAKGKP